MAADRDKQVARAEKQLRLARSRARADVITKLRRALDAFPCPVCRHTAKADAWLRVPEHDDRSGRRCAGSLRVIGWFEDGLAAIPRDRRDDRASKDARARLMRHMGALSRVSRSQRQSTSVVADRGVTRAPDVSGGLPGSSKRH